MTTWHDVDDLQRNNSHMEGELKDAKSIIREYTADHTAHNEGHECRCHTCTKAKAWLARNK